LAPGRGDHEAGGGHLLGEHVEGDGVDTLLVDDHEPLPVLARPRAQPPDGAGLREQNCSAAVAQKVRTSTDGKGGPHCSVRIERGGKDDRGGIWLFNDERISNGTYCDGPRFFTAVAKPVSPLIGGRLHA